MSSPLDSLEVTSPPLDNKDLMPIVDDPLAEQVPQTIVAPPPPMPASVSRGRRQTKKKRKRVGRACVFCQRSHMSCDDSRPCKRCVARGCADQCRDPDGKRKRRGRKRKTALPEDEDGSGSSSSGEEDLGSEVNGSETMPIGISRSKHGHHHHHDSDLVDQFGASLDACESQGSRPFFITKPKRAKLREEFSDDSDLDDVPHLAGPTSHFGVHHMHHHFDEDEHVAAIHGAQSNSSSANAGASTTVSGSSTSGPMAVPRAKRTGSVSGVPGVSGAHHDDFAHFNIYPELLTLPSPVSGSHQHAHMWFPSPRNTNGGPLLPGGTHAGHQSFEMGDAHFVASPIISGLAHSFGGNSCGSTSYLNTPNGQKGFHDFYPSGSSDHHPSFDGFIL